LQDEKVQPEKRVGGVYNGSAEPEQSPPNPDVDTNSQLKDNGVENPIQTFDHHFHEQDKTDSLVIDLDGAQKSGILSADNELAPDNEGRAGLKEGTREKRGEEDPMIRKSLGQWAQSGAKEIGEGHVSALGAQKPAPTDSTNSIGFAGGPQTSSEILPEIQTPQNQRWHQSIAPIRPVTLGNVHPQPVTVPRAKRGPKPYTGPPPNIADVVEERLVTSLRELISWLNNNPLRARPASGPGTYSKPARTIIPVPNVNDREEMLISLNKLLTENRFAGPAKIFRSFVEVTIDQERKKSGKPPAFQETAQKKLGDGKIGEIDIATRKLLRRRIHDIEKQKASASRAPNSRNSNMSSNNANNESLIQAPRVSTNSSPLRARQIPAKMQDWVFQASANVPSFEPSMTAVTASSFPQRMPATSFSSPFSAFHPSQCSGIATPAARHPSPSLRA